MMPLYGCLFEVHLPWFKIWIQKGLSCGLKDSARELERTRLEHVFGFMIQCTQSSNAGKLLSGCVDAEMKAFSQDLLGGFL